MQTHSNVKGNGIQIPKAIAVMNIRRKRGFDEKNKEREPKQVYAINGRRPAVGDRGGR